MSQMNFTFKNIYFGGLPIYYLSEGFTHAGRVSGANGG